jgi:predicted HTH domain antitoxin
MLSEQTIQELRVILKEEYDKDVSLSEASEIASTLVGYFDQLAKLSNLNNNN